VKRERNNEGNHSKSHDAFVLNALPDGLEHEFQATRT
jgi:hypothetical protein